MNIFMTDPSPTTSAIWLDDKRVNKMAVETTQMISTAVRLLCPELTKDDDILFKPAFIMHPCSVFARHSYSNFLWLLEHGIDLCREYVYRFPNKGKQHKCLGVLYHAFYLMKTKPDVLNEGFYDNPFSVTFNCSGFNTGDVYEDYKMCMNHKWLLDKQPPRWSSKSAPPWKCSKQVP